MVPRRAVLQRCCVNLLLDEIGLMAGQGESDSLQDDRPLQLCQASAYANGLNYLKDIRFPALKFSVIPDEKSCLPECLTDVS
jgi:hypothetical protein